MKKLVIILLLANGILFTSLMVQQMNFTAQAIKKGAPVVNGDTNGMAASISVMPSIWSCISSETESHRLRWPTAQRY